jgi:hypothetical protein
MSSGQRAHRRHEVTLPVEIEYQGRWIACLTRNVSLGGMFIACPEALPFGETVRLRFALEPLGRPVVTEAIVRWVDLAEGIGVQFAGLRAQEVWALQKLLAHRAGGGVTGPPAGRGEEG